MTDVHFHPAGSVGLVGVDRTQNIEATEMAAFEKGRMQGEMEAIRRLEAEQGAMQLKQFPVEQPVAVLQQPDVLEINRLTWLQRFAAGLGETLAITYIVLTIVWLHEYRGNVGWSDDESGDNLGNIGMWNTGFLSGMLGLFCLSQAILMYRILPLNTNAWLNRGIYLMWQGLATIGFILFLVAMVKTPVGEATFWGVDSWCYAAALTVWGLHMMYSAIRTIMDPVIPVKYETWAEVNNTLTTHSSPEQNRDLSQVNHAGRTVYTPAPRFPTLGHNTVPQANANVGAEVPVAPGNAPRWAENPNTHAEDYFLLPRAKWAVCGFFAMGCSILMILAGVEHSLASGRALWSQGPVVAPGTGYDKPLDQRSSESDLIGALGVITLLSVLAIAYAAMPPRTTLVKNGILAGRRSSISHNAETRIGNIV